MEPEVRERFEKIEAILAETAERDRQAGLRMDRHDARMAKYDARMAEYDARMAKQDARMAKHDARMAKHDARMAKHDARFADHDKKIEATRQLVKGGIVYIQKINDTVSALSRTVDKLAKSQQAFVDSLKKGGNGNGRKHSKF